MKPRLVTKTWACPRCDLSATVSTDREATADDLIALVVAAHEDGGCEPDPAVDPLIAQARAHRRTLRLPQWSVAETMGTVQSAVSELENGISSPTLSTFRRYLAAVGLDLVAVDVPTRVGATTPRANGSGPSVGAVEMHSRESL